MRQSACLVVNPIMADNYAAFLSLLSVAWPTGVQLVFLFAPELLSYLAPRDLQLAQSASPRV